MSIIPPTTTTTTPQLPTATLPPGSTVSASGSSTSQAGSGLGLNGVNADTFLQLLVAQMQYQDPNNPVNSTQFLSQTAAFEEVQQLGSMQTSLASLVSAQQAQTATAMLGQTVNGTDLSGSPVSGKVTGVQLTSNGPVLQVGTSSLAMSAVTSIGSSTSTGVPVGSASNPTTGSTAGAGTTTATTPTATTPTATTPTATAAGTAPTSAGTGSSGTTSAVPGSTGTPTTPAPTATAPAGTTGTSTSSTGTGTTGTGTTGTGTTGTGTTGTGTTGTGTSNTSTANPATTSASA